MRGSARRASGPRNGTRLERPRIARPCAPLPGSHGLALFWVLLPRRSPMPRLDSPRLAPLSDDEMDADTRALLGAGASGVGRGRVLNIFRTLARHPKLLKRWLVFGNHVLAKSSLGPRERELAILRVGWICRAEYEWGQHVVIARASGLSDAEIERIAAGPDAPGWSDRRPLILRGADELVSGSLPLGRELEGTLRALEHRAAGRLRVHGRPVHAGLDGAEQLRRAARRGRGGLPWLTASPSSAFIPLHLDERIQCHVPRGMASKAEELP